MPSNIEIKARLRNPETTRERALELATAPPEQIVQEDTFFQTNRGRLKLREFADGTGELIYYQRPDTVEPSESMYERVPTDEPALLKSCLQRAWGTRGVVRKCRELILIGQTRVHLDDVEGLGHYLELEVVLRDGQSDTEGRAIAEELMGTLHIESEDLVACAYIDLLAVQTH